MYLSRNSKIGSRGTQLKSFSIRGLRLPVILLINDWSLRTLGPIDAAQGTMPYMGIGDRVVMEARHPDFGDIFGKIEQRIAIPE